MLVRRQRRTRHLGGLLATLLTAQFMNNVDVAVVNVASPAIHAHLGASGAQMQFIVSGYILAYAVLLVTGARLGDVRGYGPMFLLGLVVFTAASLACGLAPDAGSLIGFRIVQGAGAALMVPQVITCIQLNFAGPALTRALAYYAVSLSGGAVAGQVLGGVVLSANLFDSSWRPLFLINVPVGVVLVLAGMRYLPKHQADLGTKRLDMLGVLLVLAAVLLLTVPLVLGRQANWPIWTWLSMAASVPVLALFVAVEQRTSRRGGYPLVDLELVRWPKIAWGLLAQTAVQATYFAVLFVLALYLQQGLGRSALYSGMALVSWVVAFGVAGFGVRRLPAQWASLVPAAGYILLGLAYAALAVAVRLGTPDGVVLMLLLGVGGLGLGTGFHAMIVHLASSVPKAYATDFSGVHSTVLQIAGTLGVAIFGTVYLSWAPHGGAAAATRGFSTICVILAATACLAVIAAFSSARHTHVVHPPSVKGPDTELALTTTGARTGRSDS